MNDLTKLNKTMPLTCGQCDDPENCVRCAAIKQPIISYDSKEETCNSCGAQDIFWNNSHADIANGADGRPISSDLMSETKMGTFSQEWEQEVVKAAKARGCINSDWTSQYAWFRMGAGWKTLQCDKRIASLTAEVNCQSPEIDSYLHIDPAADCCNIAEWLNKVIKDRDK